MGTRALTGLVVAVVGTAGIGRGQIVQYTVTDLGRPVGYNFTRPTGLNDSGQISGWFVTDNNNPDWGFVWSGRAITIINPLSVVSGASTRAYAINDNGWIVGVAIHNGQ